MRPRRSRGRDRRRRRRGGGGAEAATTGAATQRKTVGRRCARDRRHGHCRQCRRRCGARGSRARRYRSPEGHRWTRRAGVAITGTAVAAPACGGIGGDRGGRGGSSSGGHGAAHARRVVPQGDADKVVHAGKRAVRIDRHVRADGKVSGRGDGDAPCRGGDRTPATTSMTTPTAADPSTNKVAAAAAECATAAEAGRAAVTPPGRVVFLPAPQAPARGRKSRRLPSRRRSVRGGSGRGRGGGVAGDGGHGSGGGDGGSDGGGLGCFHAHGKGDPLAAVGERRVRGRIRRGGSARTQPAEHSGWRRGKGKGMWLR